MTRESYSQVIEAKELLQEVITWSEDDLTDLPPLYQRKARAYRQLLQSGEE